MRPQARTSRDPAGRMLTAAIDTSSGDTGLKSACATSSACRELASTTDIVDGFAERIQTYDPGPSFSGRPVVVWRVSRLTLHDRVPGAGRAARWRPACGPHDDRHRALGGGGGRHA